MLYRIMQGDTRLLWFTAVVMALLGGFRQQDLLFLGPVALFALYRIGVRRLMIFTAVGFVFTLLWFIPLTQNAGGIQAYLAGSSGFSAAFFNSTSLLAGAGFTGLRRNLFLKLIPYTLYAWSLAIVPALIYWGVKLPVQWRVWLRSRRAWFIALWIAPTLAFYIIIHMGQQGLVFVFMPALFLLSAEASYRLLNARPNLLWASTAAVALAGTAIFLFAPEYPLGGSDLRLLTNATIRTADRLRADEIATVRASFNPNNTVLVSEGWRYTEYYLPEYELVRISVGSKYEVNEGQILDVDSPTITADSLNLEPGSEWHLVILDFDLAQGTSEGTPAQVLQGADGVQLTYLTLQRDDTVTMDGKTYAIAHQTSAIQS
jgi:hypothetical protein